MDPFAYYAENDNDLVCSVTVDGIDLDVWQDPWDGPRCNSISLPRSEAVKLRDWLTAALACLPDR